MKKIVVFVILVIFLTGCGAIDSMDVVGDIQTERIEYPMEDEKKNLDADLANNTLQSDIKIIENTSENIFNHSFMERNLELLAECKDIKIEQAIDMTSGTTLLINARVNVDGITRVSQYEYILIDVTEEIRANLFEAVFLEKASMAEYDKRNDVWTLEIDPKIRNYFLYQISYSNGGTNIPGEQIIILENRYYNLYPFEDNRLRSVLDSRVNFSLDEAAKICERIVDSITNTSEYTIDYIQAYGNNGRRPYLKVVFKRVLDGMSITSYNDMRFLIDNDGVEKVTGSLFSARETGLEEIILSPDEAVKRLQEQADFLDFEGESQMAVTEITLEYMVMISDDGKILIIPVWRFLLGDDEDERNFLRQKILGIDAVTGELIWEERGEAM